MAEPESVDLMLTCVTENCSHYHQNNDVFRWSLFQVPLRVPLMPKAELLYAVMERNCMLSAPANVALGSGVPDNHFGGYQVHTSTQSQLHV